MNPDERARVALALMGGIFGPGTYDWLNESTSETPPELIGELPRREGYPVLPDTVRTPGRTRDLSLEQILSTKWSKDPRLVTDAMKRQAFDNYGLTGYDDPSYARDEHDRSYQIDHLVPRQLGGADDIGNLWPMPYNPNEIEDDPWHQLHPEDARGTSPWQPWDVVRKDMTGNKLAREVRDGRMSLEDAQRAFKDYDWRDYYVKFFGQPRAGYSGAAPR